MIRELTAEEALLGAVDAPVRMVDASEENWLLTEEATTERVSEAEASVLETRDEYFDSTLETLLESSDEITCDEERVDVSVNEGSMVVMR